jgi:DNA-directed RNA polymerase subunit RPC12/RpoP
MSIKFPCPGCKKGLTAKDDQAGKKVVCPACKKPLIIPQPSTAKQNSGSGAAPRARPATKPAPDATPAEIEAAAAALLSDAMAASPGTSTTIDFICEHCDAAVSVPLADSGKNVPCPECKRIIKVRPPVKADPSNWRRADRHLPSAAKAPDEPAPEGAWGNLTRTVVSREALEEADAIPEKPELVPLRERVFFWSRIAIGVICVTVAGLYGYHRFAVNRERRALESVTSYAGDPKTVKQIGPERVGMLHTLSGAYYTRARIPYSDAPLSGERGSAESAREEFDRALKVLQNADPLSADRDFALADLALAMVEIGGDKDEQREKTRSTWDDCLRHIRAALSSIHAPEAKLEAYRAISARLFERGQPEAAQSLASTAFSESRVEKTAARAIGLLESIERGGDKVAAGRACDEILKEYAGKNPPSLTAPVVTLAMVLDKTLPPPPAKSKEAEENTWIGKAEGLARKGQLPEGRKQALDAPTKRIKLRSLVAIGSASKQGADDLASACKMVIDGLDDSADETRVLLRLVRLGVPAGVPEALLGKVADAIVDPALRARAKLELCRARLNQMKESAGIDIADSVDQQMPSGALARAELARHNARYDKGYLRTAESWPDPLGAFGTLGALLATQKDSD